MVGHGVTFAHLWESMCGYEAQLDTEFSRTLALELERIAVHVGDLSGACTDIAYQLGSAVFGRLRTPIINFLQEWCGNRIAKGLIRPGHNQFPFTPALGERLKHVLMYLNPSLTKCPKSYFRYPVLCHVSNEPA